MTWQGQRRKQLPSNWAQALSMTRAAEPLMVTNADGTREPWSLEWQVKDDARFYLERQVRRMLPDEGS